VSVSAKQFHLWSSWSVLLVLVIVLGMSTNQEWIHETVKDDTHVFKYDSSILVCLGLIGLVSARVLWLLRGSPRGMVSAIKMHLACVGVLCGFISVFFAFFVAEVNSKGFEIRRGLGGLGVSQAEFANVKRVRLTWERHNEGRSGIVSHYYLLCEKKEGADTKLLVSGDRIMRTVAAQILERVAEYDIPVSKPYGADISMWHAGN